VRLESSTKSLSWLRALALGGLALVLSIFAWGPMLALYPHTQWGDGSFFQKMVEAARASVVYYHELPLWNPYECGGVPLWDNPQAPISTPLLWVMLLVPTARAIEIWYIAHTAVGFMCMWIFARRELRLGSTATFLASAVWTFAGVHWHHLTGGSLTWVPFFYAPLMLFLWRHAERDRRLAVALGALIALTIYEGGVYPLAFAVVFLGAETLTRAWPPRRIPRIALLGLIVLAVAITLGAARFLPVADQIRSHTRGLGSESDYLRWDTLKDVFLRRDHDRPVAGQSYVWTEYSDYLGPFILAFALVGMALAGAGRLWMVALALLAFGITLGHFAAYAPWSIMKHFFPFKEMRVPSRFLSWLTVFLAGFAGIGFEKLSAAARRFALSAGFSDALRVALTGIAFIGIGDMISVQIDWCERFFHESPSQTVERSARFYYGGSDLTQFIDQPKQNRGRLDCWEEWGFSAGAPLWQGDVPQARAQDDAAVVETVNRTQNTFTVDVNVKRPARILLNTGYDKGWRSDVGTPGEQNKQLIVDLPPGRHRVHVKYWPKTLVAGFLLTALGMVGSVLFLKWESSRRRKAG
jgi:hypothetical protein